MTGTFAGGLTCPLPATGSDCVQLGHGSGGKLSARLLASHFLPRFKNDILTRLGDAAVLQAGSQTVAITTDSFVVQPLEFPGGNIGTVAVHGTLNDLAMMGARPCCLTSGFILEEGLSLSQLDRIVSAMARAAKEAGVPLVAGDTKVVERGKGDGVFINTTGLGLIDSQFGPAPDRARPGDVVLVSGPLGCHGMAIMTAREGLGFSTTIESDTANLWPLVEILRDLGGQDIHVLRDPTRGGLASTLNEIADCSRVGMVLQESALPVPDNVAAACETLGLDPLYVANEGVMAAIFPARLGAAALAALREHPLGRSAALIGQVTDDHPGLVVCRTPIGGTRIIDLLPGDQLPRIC